MIRQFDVLENPDVESRPRVPYVVVVQSHLLYGIETVLVAPLVRPELVIADGSISLSVQFEGETLTLDSALLAHIKSSRLKSAAGSLAEYDYEIRRALDRLFTGF